MGEYIPRPADAPVEGGGMDAEKAKKFLELSMALQASPQKSMDNVLAETIAKQTGKSLDEVLKFLGTSSTPPQTVTSELQPEVELPAKLKDVKIPLPVEETVIVPEAKAAAPKVTTNSSGVEEVITETITDEEADDATLEKLNDEEEEYYDGKIRVGSKVVVIYDVPGARLRWKGRKGIVTRIIGDEKAKVFEIEFPKGKYPFTRRNKKTGKIEKGYQIKKIRNTFDIENIELV